MLRYASDTMPNLAYPVPAIRRAPSYATDDSGRMSSSLSNSSNSSLKRKAVTFSSETEIDCDSGVDENRSFHKSPSPCFFVDAPRLDQCTVNLVARLREYIEGVEFFLQLADRKSSCNDDLTQAIKLKLKPRLLTLDEDVVIIVDDIKADIDRCRISDRRLGLLLTYNDFLQEIRDLSQKILADILQTWEDQIRLVERGVCGIPSRRQEIQKTLSEVLKAAYRLEIKVRNEGTRQRRQQISPTSTNRRSSSGSRSRRFANF